MQSYEKNYRKGENMSLMDIFVVLGAIGSILILIAIIAGALRPHREVWDDVPDIKMQEGLNKTRKKMGLKQKEIDYKTGMIK